MLLVPLSALLKLWQGERTVQALGYARNGALSMAILVLLSAILIVQMRLPMTSTNRNSN